MVKKIATVIIMTIMFSVFILDIITVVLCNKYEDRYEITAETFDSDGTADRIHFLNTGNSDSILIESNGHFALVDSGEGSNNPKVNARINGYENVVIDYIKKIAGDENGKVVLDFVMATHYHYDHAGCFEAIINDKDITIKTAYFKKYYVERARPGELKSWHMDKIYDTIIGSLKKRGFNIVSDIPSEPFQLGDFTVQFFNTKADINDRNISENDNSIGTKLTKGDFSAFLAADITNLHGLERRLAPQIGRVDLLKLGHHGYAEASNRTFIKTLMPKAAIVTNGLGKIYPNVKWNLTMISHTSTYSTVKENGIVVDVDDSGGMRFTNDINIEN